MRLNNYQHIYELKLTQPQDSSGSSRSSLIVDNVRYIVFTALEDYLLQTTTYTLLFETMKNRDNLILALKSKCSYTLKDYPNTANVDEIFING